MTLQPTTLNGILIRLEPMSQSHVQGLFQAASFPSLWDYTFDPGPKSEEELATEIAGVQEQMTCGEAIGFATILQDTDEVIGSTRLWTISAEHQTMEIGYTWITPGWQGKGANIEAKLLMLQHAFETLGVMRLEMKTDSRNLNSQHAMQALGAQREGIFRKHRILPDGYIRDTVYFSIIDDDWPQVKQHLQTRFAAKTNR